jgi:superoxide reductase
VATFDLGPTFSEPNVKFPMKLEQSATIWALELCNIHGVWENSFRVEVK